MCARSTGTASEPRIAPMTRMNGRPVSIVLLARPANSAVLRPPRELGGPSPAPRTRWSSAVRSMFEVQRSMFDIGDSSASIGGIGPAGSGEVISSLYPRLGQRPRPTRLGCWTFNVSPHHHPPPSTALEPRNTRSTRMNDWAAGLTTRSTKITARQGRNQIRGMRPRNQIRGMRPAVAG